MARGKQKDRKASAKGHHPKPPRDGVQSVAPAEGKDAQETPKKDSETLQSENLEQQDLILNHSVVADAKETALNEGETSAPANTTEESATPHEVQGAKEVSVTEPDAVESSEKVSEQA